MGVSVNAGGGGGGGRKRSGVTVSFGCFGRTLLWILVICTLVYLVIEQSRLKKDINLLRNVIAGSPDVRSLAEEAKKHGDKTEAAIRQGNTELAAREAALNADTLNRMNQFIRRQEKLAIQENPTTLDILRGFFLGIIAFFKGLLGLK